MLTVKDVAERAGVSGGLVYDWIASGMLSHYRMGRSGRRGGIRVAAADLEAFLLTLRQGGRGKGLPRLLYRPSVGSSTCRFVKNVVLSMSSVHFNSEDHTWETPAGLFKRLDDEFHFDLDVCALPATAKCERFFSPEDDGLSQAWSGVCWMNPPYGRVIGDWMRKALRESLRGCTVVCLVPARTDTEWWHEYAIQGEIRFIRGRLKFGNAASGAPFPSAVVIFRDRWWERRKQRVV